jgi:hypothetical protein
MSLIYLVRHAEPAATWGAHPNPDQSELRYIQGEEAHKSYRKIQDRHKPSGSHAM